MLSILHFCLKVHAISGVSTRMCKILRGVDANMWIYHMYCDLQWLKLIVVSVSCFYKSLFSMFERQVLISTSFCTDGCCLVADCGTAKVKYYCHAYMCCICHMIRNTPTNKLSNLLVWACRLISLFGILENQALRSQIKRLYDRSNRLCVHG